MIGKAYQARGISASSAQAATAWSALRVEAGGRSCFHQLGEAGAAARLTDATERTLAAGDVLPRDLGGSATTAEVTARVCAVIAGRNL